MNDVLIMIYLCSKNIKTALTVNNYFYNVFFFSADRVDSQSQCKEGELRVNVSVILSNGT